MDKNPKAKRGAQICTEKQSMVRVIHDTAKSLFKWSL